MEFFGKAIESIGEKFSTSILGYFNLWSYLDQSLRWKVSSGKTHKINSCLEFYQNLEAGIIKHGDRILLNEFFVSEWVPRSAGAIALRYGGKEEYGSYPTAYAPWCTTILGRSFVPPSGSVRFPLKRGSDIILSAVTSGEYNTDLGLVLSVSQSVYSEFLSKQTGHNAVEANLEGYVDLFDTGKCIGFNLEFNELSRNLISKSYVIRVISPIQVAFKSHSSHPRFTAWVIRKKIYRESPVLFYRFGNSGMERVMGDCTQYDYYQWPLLTNSRDELRAVRDMLINDREGTNFAESNIKILTKVESLKVLQEIKKLKQSETHDVLAADQLTEFDGRTASDSIIPLQTDPRLSSIQMSEILQHILKLERTLLNR